MKLVDKVNKLFKATDFSIVEVGVIATRLGIWDKKEDIHKRHFKVMFDEIADEVEKAIPVASESQLQTTLDYIEQRSKLRPEEREEGIELDKLPS